ncbi:unnamed protein product [Phytophthora lilii]|uniref:Unnamed protein product n=1 Tax=Phytophthora lilii TaxID=2077276 RepID=A0A9W6TGW5_9STRA|nr:unnamed protein product [Phytophthora lilii]
MALSAPDDHVNPDLRFPQLPQPYRRVKKILENDIFDAAWDIITSESTRFKADNSTVDGLVSSSRSNRGTNKIRSNLQQQSNDYDVAKKRLCEPTWNIPLDNTAQQIAGLTSHCLLPLVVAGINRDPLKDSDEAFVASLRVISTAENETTVLGDFPVEFPGDAQKPPSPDTITKVHVSIKRLSSLQLTNVESSNCRACIAVHLIETRTSEPANQEPSEDVQPAVPSIRECVSVYEVTQVLQHPSDDAVPERKISCRLLAMTNPTNGSLEPLISSIVLSPDSLFLAVTSVSSTVVQLYRLQREETSEAIEAGPQPVLLSSSTFQVDLEPTRSPFMQDECEPALYFLVAPVPTCVSNDELPRAAPITYAFAICYGLKVIKVLLPPTNSSNGAPSVVLNPVKTWEHLTKITASAQDITTQYLAVGCQDGTIVVWDVLQDADFAFLSPLNEVNSNQVERSSSRQKMPRAPTLSEISDVIFSHAGYVIALSKSQQRLYFFDVRERGNPMLKRVVSQPEMASSTTTRQVSLQSGSSMVTVAASAATANAPIALIRYFNGMVMIYDVRTADAIGSFQTMSSMATSPKAHPVSSLTNIASNEMNTTMVSIVGNQHALSVAVNSVSSAEVGEACVKLYSWRNILLVCYPYLAAALEERNEEPVRCIFVFFLRDSTSYSSFLMADKLNP